ncbi:MAG: hypothetical protein QM501_03025 [Gimesia sp.]
MNRTVFLRSGIVAIIIGSVLTVINQRGWIRGSDPLQLLPLILVFVTPFVVVAVSQVVAIRKAFIDAGKYESSANPEGFFATTISHGIPVRAVAIGLTIGSINALISIADTLLHMDDLTTLSIIPLSQGYLLPLLFGILSQAISYRRAAQRFRNPVEIAVFNL